MFSLNRLKRFALWKLLVSLIVITKLFILFSLIYFRSETIISTCLYMQKKIDRFAEDAYYNQIRSNTSYIKYKVMEYNNQEKVYNEYVFGPLRSDSVVIVIQVHNRIAYLRYLIDSLSEARKISDTLLIFSHDYIDEEINQLIQTITFCKYMQIFYPYSMQIYPDEFPGNDPNDCPKYLSQDEALNMKCNNALYTDLYKHYREARYAQLKHHWWWKANRVFSVLGKTKNHNGLFLFMEEDHYVANDFILVLEIMTSKRCQNCNMLSLGSISRKMLSRRTIEVTPIFSNLGLAFNRTTWLSIVNCVDAFCRYDDYNWDWSLQNVIQNCFPEESKCMVLVESRVFHIGNCGFHISEKECDPIQTISNIKNMLKSENYKNPESYELIYNRLKPEPIKMYGGWGDNRDHIFCLGMTV